jgi:hypothetical protein
MAKDPAFLFYPGDYLRDTQTLSEKAQVAYDRIMCEHMRYICISQAQLKFFTKRLNEDELEELMFVLVEVDGGYQIEWVADSINKRKAYSESRRNNRVGKKQKKRTNTSTSYDKHMENENEIENVNKDEDVIESEFEILQYPSFDDFWNLYDKKVDRTKAEAKWKLLSQKEKEEAVEYIPAYKLAQPDKKFRRNPETFINNKTWQNEIITNNGQQTKKHNFVFTADDFKR